MKYDYPLIDNGCPPAADMTFIIGMTRAGTTIVDVLLSKLPGVVVLNEVWLLGVMEDLRTRTRSSFPSGATANIEQLLGWWKKDDGAVGVPASVVRSQIDALRASVPAQRMFGDKAAAYAGSIEDLRTIFPDCKLIVCFRDLWDRIASAIDSPNWPTANNPSPADVAQYMAPKAADRELHYRELAKRHNAYCLQFEDFAADPSSTFEGLMRWLGLDDPLPDEVLQTNHRQSVDHWKRVPVVVAAREIIGT